MPTRNTLVDVEDEPQPSAGSSSIRSSHALTEPTAAAAAAAAIAAAVVIEECVLIYFYMYNLVQRN